MLAPLLRRAANADVRRAARAPFAPWRGGAGARGRRAAASGAAPPARPRRAGASGRAPWASGAGASPSALPRPRRGFSTAVFSFEARGQAPEQTLFVVGMDEGKFFGQDSAEEALKLLERVMEHNKSYHLLLGLSKRDLDRIDEEHKVKEKRLTASRTLEGKRHAEFIPVVQASQIDKNPSKALDRILRTTQARVAWKLWQTPREALHLYWAFFQRKKYKNDASRRFWTRHFPACAHFYFNERSELIAIRAIEHLAALQAQSRGGTSVLVVGNDVYAIVTDRIRSMLGAEAQASHRLGDQEFLAHLRKAIVALTTDVPDLTPLIVFVYAGLPFLVAQFALLGVQYWADKFKVGEAIFGAEHYRE